MEKSVGSFVPDPLQNLVPETIPLNDVRRTYPKKLEEMVNNINTTSFYDTFLAICADPDSLVVAIHCETIPHRQYDPMYREVQSLPTLQKYFATRMQSIPDAVFSIEKSQVYRVMQQNKKKKKGSELHLHFQLTGSIISETIWKNAETSLDLNFAVNSLSSMASISSSSHSSSLINPSCNQFAASHNNVPQMEDINHIIKRSSEQMITSAPTRRKRSRRKEDMSESSTQSNASCEGDLESNNSFTNKSPRIDSSQRDLMSLQRSETSIDSIHSQIVIQQLDLTSSVVPTRLDASAATISSSFATASPVAPITFHLPQLSEPECHQVRVGTSVFILSKDKETSYSSQEYAYRSTAIATRDTEFFIGNKIPPKSQLWRGVLILHLTEDHKIQRITAKYISEPRNSV